LARLKRWAFLGVVEYLGKLSVAVALVLWVWERPDRETQSKLRAWQVLVEAEVSQTKASGGRIEALEFLSGKGVELSGVDLHEAYLPAVKLAGAVLNRATFKRAILSDAHFEGAYLKAANLDEAYLTGAKLNGAHLEHARLRGARFAGPHDDQTEYKREYQRRDPGGFVVRMTYSYPADLTDAFLFGADLTDARLSGAMLRGADLRHARLDRASLGGTDLTGVGVGGASLNGTVIYGAQFHGAIGVTQEQIDAAKGDTSTTLPTGIVMPANWRPPSEE